MCLEDWRYDWDRWMRRYRCVLHVMDYFIIKPADYKAYKFDKTCGALRSLGICDDDGFSCEKVCVTSFIKGPLSCFETMLKANLKQQGLSCKTLFHVYPQILFSVEAFITIGTLVSLFFMYWLNVNFQLLFARIFLLT